MGFLYAKDEKGKIDWDKMATPTPANPLAIEYAELLMQVSYTKSALDHEMENVPHYTAQYDHKDYYAQEQEDYNRAVDALFDFMKKNFLQPVQVISITRDEFYRGE